MTLPPDVIALITFITVVAVNIPGLLLDWWLEESGKKTITQRVRGLTNPSFAIILTLMGMFQASGAIGFVLHFIL